MVLRKPVPPNTLITPKQQELENLPYPVTPTSPGQTTPQDDSKDSDEVYSPSLHHSPAFNLSNLSKVQLSMREGGMEGKGKAPAGAEHKSREELPESLRVGQGLSRDDAPQEQRLPESLRVGPPEGTPRRSPDGEASYTGDRSNSHSPRRMGQNAEQPPDAPSSTSSWDNQSNDSMHSSPAAHPVTSELEELPAQSTNTFNTSNPAPPSSQRPRPPIPSNQPPPVPSNQPPAIPNPPEPEPTHHDLELRNFQSVWSEESQEDQEMGVIRVGLGRAELDGHPQIAEEVWHVGDPSALRSPPMLGRSLPEAITVDRPEDDPAHPLSHPPEDEPAPPLPPQEQIEEERPPVPPRPETPPLPPRPQTPPMPPRPDNSLENNESQTHANAEENEARIKKQRSETYQIRQINWHDFTSPQNPRRSPILVQNANGPCPLLALVNALVLTTPHGVETALVETLRVREQVSLGLLLDAVFDELISGRRSDSTKALPDVADLYAFLLTLHTGMNVNPRFVPPEIPNLLDLSESELSQSVSAKDQAGGFEETREMRLYSTFAIPLVHGWIPSKEDPAFSSLQRSAKTYEDAQNVLFREEELESKLQRNGLTPNEQRLFEDIAAIQYFLVQTATQLTHHGLETIRRSLSPGSIAILFRNDHFSTLYKHPQTNQLLTLVTDAGYATHDEVVWESLEDITGERSAFYSGDFRAVGHEAPSQGGTSGSSHAETSPTDGEGWTTVHRSNQQGRPTPGTSGVASPSNSQSPSVGSIADRLSHATVDDPDLAMPRTTSAEQEDRDLALALQLQEEEEDRHRRDQAARRREETLSRQFLSQESGTNNNNLSQSHPSSRNSNNNNQNASSPNSSSPRPLVPPRHTSSNEEDAPPPSYEQAATLRPYNPPPDHPAHSPRPDNGMSHTTIPVRHARNSSAYSQNGTPFFGGPSTHQTAPPQQRRRSSARLAVTPSQTLIDRIPSSASAGPGGRRPSGAVPTSALAEEDPRRGDCVVM
ncbi:MAG: hypothetical protein M1819_006480 [Sarea resinae]|nr:MAG: hypothetical protein M1819_006480 [Sarea resinae]